MEVCNPIGCVLNENCLLISVRDKTPEDFKQVLVKVENFSLEINWSSPNVLNGRLQYYTVYIIEIDLEIDIFLDSKSEFKIFEISLRNVLEFQRFLFVPVKSTNFNRKLTDLKPSEIYTLKLFGCNNAGCASGQFEKIETNDSIISGFESLAVFVVGQNRVEIEFEDPTETNGAVTMFRIYRNEFVIAEFDPSSPSLLKTGARVL